MYIEKTFMMSYITVCKFAYMLITFKQPRIIRPPSGGSGGDEAADAGS